MVEIRLKFLDLGHRAAPKCKRLLSVRHPKYYKMILDNILSYHLNSLNCSCHATNRIPLDFSLHISWSASSPTSGSYPADKQRNRQSENISTFNLGGGHYSLPSVVNSWAQYFRIWTQQQQETQHQQQTSHKIYSPMTAENIYHLTKNTGCCTLADNFAKRNVNRFSVFFHSVNHQ